MVAPSAIADRLRADILELRFVQGEALREIPLAEEFGASRRSVRDALMMLAHEGLVTHERNRGARVRRFSASDVHDLYVARAVLEAEGARRCADAPDASLDAVQVALLELRRAAELGQDTPRHAKADVAFHAAVIALAGSARLDDFFSRIRGEMTYAIRLLQREEVVHGQRDTEVLGDHEDIAAAILDRDPLGAESAVLEHVRVNEGLLAVIAAARD
jgi:DNA-binding GntR family transcriptional regulator